MNFDDQQPIYPPQLVTQLFSYSCLLLSTVTVMPTPPGPSFFEPNSFCELYEGEDAAKHSSLVTGRRCRYCGLKNPSYTATGTSTADSSIEATVLTIIDTMPVDLTKDSPRVIANQSRPLPP